MVKKNMLIINITLATLILSLLSPPPMAAAGGGSWQLLQKSIGVSAMHMQLLHNDHVVIFDRTDFGRSNLSLPAGKCRDDPSDTSVKHDCTAHSVDYDAATNTFRALMIQTDVWCSSGAVMPDGTLIQTGGFNDGDRRVRRFTPCVTGAGCDWKEVRLGLSARRWYSTNQILPGGKQIIVGGRRQFNYEFFPKETTSTKTAIFVLPFLAQTNDKRIENNLYPFVFLCPDGKLFVFANNRAVLLDYKKNRVVKTYPTIPGGDPRSYPSTGSAVLLPLKNIQAKRVEAEVLVCGGAPKGSFARALKGVFVQALKTCARVKVFDPRPVWVVETMPSSRTMGDMVMLGNGEVLLVNGAGSGTAGWELGRKPNLNPVVYRPEKKPGSRFVVLNPSSIPRMYHSTAVLLRDGRVLVGGSNPHVGYNFSRVVFPTELSLECFRPGYLGTRFGNVRPKILLPLAQAKLRYAQKMAVRFRIGGNVTQSFIKVTMISPSFNTHSFSMNQRLLVLPMAKVRFLGKKTSQVEVTMPGFANLAPSGYYMLFVVHRDIPSVGVWVHIS